MTKLENRITNKIYRIFVNSIWSGLFDYPSVGYYAWEHLKDE